MRVVARLPRVGDGSIEGITGEILSVGEGDTSREQRAGVEAAERCFQTFVKGNEELRKREIDIAAIFIGIIKLIVAGGITVETSQAYYFQIEIEVYVFEAFKCVAVDQAKVHKRTW